MRLFQIDESVFQTSFFRKEVVTNAGKRHLIFATDEQLDVMKNAKSWYIDGTFKVVRKPFEMLLSIHAFVRRGDCS